MFIVPFMIFESFLSFLGHNGGFGLFVVSRNQKSKNFRFMTDEILNVCMWESQFSLVYVN